ncbi:hypothetical protein MAMT_01890 [Methylacidimicrobium tartarophylax]|uniref:Uncharacterized protein n=1 Tax=Methylacidimicrobium tartarophylax TaxID=1041768 RepID=A0A5E6MFG5_9BACT|nr:hypothetical protein MAMT_01890 [Methylacidimicrobium tartarophylax]
MNRYRHLLLLPLPWANIGVGDHGSRLESASEGADPGKQRAG